MALNNNSKLNLFAAEANSEADKICVEIRAAIDKERQEELRNGRQLIEQEQRDRVAKETERIRKDNALTVSRKKTDLQHDYLLKIEATAELVMDSVRGRLIEFAKTDSYAAFLCRIVGKAEQDYPDGIVACCAQKDAEIIQKLRVEYRIDEGIRIGGLKIHPKGRNIQLNETLDARLEQSEEMLDKLISEYFHD